MLGSATLDWPGETEKDLGTIILLIDRFAANPDSASEFAYKFYYCGNNYTHILQNMTRQMIVPFTRDYIEYVKLRTGSSEMTMLPARTGPADRKVFVVHGGMMKVREKRSHATWKSSVLKQLSCMSRPTRILKFAIVETKQSRQHQYFALPAQSPSLR
jgi:hypothetical protein